MAEATPTFQFLPGPRVEYYGQEEQFWRQRAAKLQELARARNVGPTEMGNLTAVCRSVRDGGSGSQASSDLQPGSMNSPTSVLADYKVGTPIASDLLLPTDMQDRQAVKQQLQVQKRLLELAELQEEVLQQLQALEAAKMQMAEQKLAEQTRLTADLDVRLQAACGSLDCSADIACLSTRLQQSPASREDLMTNASWEQLSAQCDRLMRNGVTLRNSQPGPTSWAWMGEEPPGTALGNLKQKIASLEEALATERRKKADLAQEVLQKALQLKEIKTSGGVVREASDVSEQLNDTQKRFESAMRDPHGAHVANSEVQQKQHRMRQQGISIDALSMLREAVNLSPEGKALTPDAALSHPADSADSDSEELPQHPSTSRHSSAHQSMTADGRCTVSEQGQEVGAGAAVLREAYKEMLLQQQARHRAELDKRQAKYQRQLDAQAKAHEEAMGGLIKAGYIKTCTEGDLRLSGPLSGQVKMLLEENLALQGNISALKDDIANRVEYAMWQQRQTHEANLGQLYQQHAQELQAAGPAAQQMHEEEVKTLVSEAVQAKEAEHAADLANLQNGFEAQLEECEADLKERDRQYSSLLRELKALKRRYRSTDASSVSSEEPHEFNRLRLDKLLGPYIDDSPPCQGSPPNRLSNPQRTGRPVCALSGRRQPGVNAAVQARPASVESPLTSMVNAVLGNRERRALSSAQCSPQKPAHLPELLPCNSSPDTAHARWFSKSKQQQAEVCATSSSVQSEGRHQQAHDDEAELHAEPTFSQTHERAQSAAPAAACCLRCGLSQFGSQRASDCRFHPALLTDPGPFLYSPEWHACRAAKHDCTHPGCYVRQGHYFPGRAVQDLVSASGAADSPDSNTVQFDLQPQPRTRLPVPRCKAYS